MASRQSMLLAAAGAAAAFLGVSAFAVDYLPVDLAVTHLVQSRAPSWLDPVMLSASWVGGTFPLFGVLVLTMALLAWKGKGSHIPLPLLLGVAAVLVPVLKELVNRPRPSVDLVHVYVKVVGDSFPSGHAFMSASILGGVFLLADELLEARWAVRLLRSLLVALVMAIGASRVYLGVHWASDVIGGFLLGLLALAAVARFHEGRLARRSAEGEGTEAAARAPTTA